MSRSSTRSSVPAAVPFSEMDMVWVDNTRVPDRPVFSATGPHVDLASTVDPMVKPGRSVSRPPANMRRLPEAAAGRPSASG